MRRSLPIYAHGIEKLETAAGKLRGAELRASVTLPERRRSTRLEILLAPSLAVAMLDALPYLIEYPYGCTEQTMSRFLPAVITARTLAELGLAREDVVGRVFGGIEPEHARRPSPTAPGIWTSSTRWFATGSTAWPTSSTATAAWAGGSPGRAIPS